MQTSNSVHSLKTWLYGLPPAPKRFRTKPMRVICVGPPRSATESLAVALRELGYTTCHGWDLNCDDPSYLQSWVTLARKKWCGNTGGDVSITASEFDELIGHSDAVIDTIAWAFAPEVIAAYPDAKVILNIRRDRGMPEFSYSCCCCIS